MKHVTFLHSNYILFLHTDNKHLENIMGEKDLIINNNQEVTMRPLGRNSTKDVQDLSEKITKLD